MIVGVAETKNGWSLHWLAFSIGRLPVAESLAPPTVALAVMVSVRSHPFAVLGGRSAASDGRDGGGKRQPQHRRQKMLHIYRIS